MCGGLVLISLECNLSQLHLSFNKCSMLKVHRSIYACTITKTSGSYPRTNPPATFMQHSTSCFTSKLSLISNVGCLFRASFDHRKTLSALLTIFTFAFISSSYEYRVNDCLVIKVRNVNVYNLNCSMSNKSSSLCIISLFIGYGIENSVGDEKGEPMKEECWHGMETTKKY